METQYNSFYITTLQTQNVEPLSFKSENKEKILLILNVTLHVNMKICQTHK